jgi:uncharacterized protein YegP (UPF0339 family)
MKIVVFRDAARRYRIRILFSNGRIVATSEAYSSLAKALQSARSLQKHMVQANIKVETS